MNYELAKQLKEAGFSQGKLLDCDTYINDDNSYTTYQYASPNALYLPNLSELIEACGDKFSSLTRSPRNTWYTSTPKGEGKYEYEFVVGIEGSTPEEAVANLWLALNKK
jgi:hypothetical protein